MNYFLSILPVSFPLLLYLARFARCSIYKVTYYVQVFKIVESICSKEVGDPSGLYETQNTSLVDGDYDIDSRFTILPLAFCKIDFRQKSILTEILFLDLKISCDGYRV